MRVSRSVITIGLALVTALGGAGVASARPAPPAYGSHDNGRYGHHDHGRYGHHHGGWRHRDHGRYGHHGRGWNGHHHGGWYRHDYR